MMADARRALDSKDREEIVAWAKEISARRELSVVGGWAGSFGAGAVNVAARACVVLAVSGPRAAPCAQVRRARDARERAQRTAQR